MPQDYSGVNVTVIGGGPVGCVLAELLSRRGFDVEVYEKRPDMRATDISAGRSINLVLTRRGLKALALLGLRERVLEITVPVLGRMMHAVDGELTYQPYGKDDSECNYSVSRGMLNEFLLTAAEDAGVRIHFGHELVDADFESGQLTFELEDGTTNKVDGGVIFGADGSFSGVREVLVRDHGFDSRIEWLDHGYKEMVFPADDNGDYQMEKNALHIWPRGDHMLMALADLDGSFTGTIYMPWEGDVSFGSAESAEGLNDLFENHYPDSIPLLGDLETNYREHPASKLGTVRCAPWHLEDRALLVGDAAHGIVPFFGQGLNCGLEDCSVLNRLFDEYDSLSEVFEAFDARRKPNGDAIADMAIENFVEMRDKVGDEEFLRRKKFELRLERELTHLYRSRYATVMYSSNAYKAAFDAGRIQDRILAKLMAEYDTPEEMDLARAESLINAELTPFYREHEVDLSF